MSDWTDGYVCEIDYTQGFYRELTPSFLAFCLLLKGIRPPSPTAPFSFCELGFGQGFGTNLIAAANPHGQFWGTDFNPSHGVAAQTLATAAGSDNIRVFDKSFAEFLDHDLPDFDIVALHGIYSWVSQENRTTIVEFLRRRLKPGGLVYISYNALPGWSATMPLRHLMVEHAAGSTEAMAVRIDKAIAFARQLADLKAGYFQKNPIVGPRLDKMQGLSRHYLAHEYFNRDWTPQHFAEVARELAAAKLSFAVSANPADHLDALNLSGEAQQVLAGVADETFRQTVRDYFLNQQFRKDIFVRGMARLSPQEQTELLLATRFALIVPRAAIPARASYAAGEVDLRHETYLPVIDALANGPMTLADLLGSNGVRQLGFGVVLQTAIVLTAAGALAPCLPAASDGERSRTAAGFNAAIVESARFRDDRGYLASPVTGGGIELSRINQLFLLAARRNVDPAGFIWPILAEQRQGVIKDGKPLTTPEENLAELRLMAETFRAQTLPLLQQHGIV